MSIICTQRLGCTDCGHTNTHITVDHIRFHSTPEALDSHHSFVVAQSSGRPANTPWAPTIRSNHQTPCRTPCVRSVRRVAVLPERVPVVFPRMAREALRPCTLHSPPQPCSDPDGVLFASLVLAGRHCAAKASEGSSSLIVASCS